MLEKILLVSMEGGLERIPTPFPCPEGDNHDQQQKVGEAWEEIKSKHMAARSQSLTVRLCIKGKFTHQMTRWKVKD